MKKALLVPFLLVIAVGILVGYEPPNNVKYVTWADFLVPLLLSDGTQVFSMDVTVRGVAKLEHYDEEYYLSLVINNNDRMNGYLSSTDIFEGLPNSRIRIFFTYSGSTMEPFRFVGYQVL